MKHTYYIPSHHKVYGDEKDNLELVAKLYAIYMSVLDMSKSPGRYDGVSIADGRIRVCVNHNGGSVKMGGNTAPQDPSRVFDYEQASESN